MIVTTELARQLTELEARHAALVAALEALVTMWHDRARELRQLTFQPTHERPSVAAYHVSQCGDELRDRLRQHRERSA